MNDVVRVWVLGGRFIDTVDLGTTYYAAPYPTPYQLFTEEGEPARGSYRGPGVVLERDGERWLMLGDPRGSTTLTEYRIAREPSLSDDDRREREHYRAGFAAGADGARKRPRANAPALWREGWKDGRGAIGREP